MDKTSRVLDLYNRLIDPYEIVHDAKIEAKYYNVSASTINDDLKCIRNYFKIQAKFEYERILKDIEEKSIYNYDYYINERRLEYNKSVGVYTVKMYTVKAKDFKKLLDKEEADKIKSKLKSLQDDEV